VTQRASTLTELGAIATIAAYNVVSHRHIDRRARLVANVTAAAALVGLGRVAGLGVSELGLGRSDFRRGLRFGLATAVPIAAAVTTALAVPQSRRLLADEKITGTGRAEAAFETLVRIPLETALAEELIFRGVLLGLGLRNRSKIGAVVASSVWFGLWHVYPTLGSVGRGGGGELVGDRPHQVGGATAAVVAATAGAGIGFAVLRLRSGSIAAPVIAHAVLNMTAFAGVRLTAERTPGLPAGRIGRPEPPRVVS
jgi:membrane protease YdiL (CAAX protease family)